MTKKLQRYALTEDLTLGKPSYKNKLAKARKTRTSPSTLGLKKFGLGKTKCHSIRHQTPKFPTPQKSSGGFQGVQGGVRGHHGRLGYSRRQN